MKRTLSVILLFALITALFSCNRKRRYSYEDITSHSTGEAEEVEINSFLLQSFRLALDPEKAEYLDMLFEETDKDIFSLTYGYDESTELPDYLAAMLYVRCNDNDLILFIFSEDGYIYCYSEALQSSFKSCEQLDRSFFDGIDYFTKEQLDKIYG